MRIFYSYTGDILLGGKRNVVEIDKSKFDKRKYNKGNHVEGVWVFGAVEWGSTNILLMPVTKRTKLI